MSYSIHGRVNVGAYERPFSGVGIEFAPLANNPGQTGIVLHEAGYLSANRNWKFPNTFSPFWRLYYNQKVGHHARFGESCVELTPEHIMLIPPHCLCHLLGVSPVPHFWITFSFTRSPADDQALPVLLKPRETEMCLIRDAQRLILADKTWEPRDEILGTGMALLDVVLARPELRWKPSMPENMERVRRAIEERFGKALPNSDLAQVAGLCVAGFERTFKRHFGTTAARYVTELRVRAAAHLLLQTDQTLDAIAAQTGFPNRAYFSRVFKNVTAEPPAGFRRKHRRTT
jgi:AraC family transcriptional regulator, arabinose operon regulatory protein